MGNVNGYFQVAVKGDGTYLHIVPAQGTGRILETGEIVSYLVAKGINFDLLIVDNAVKKQAEVEVKLNADKPLLEREASEIKIDEDGMRATIKFYPPFVGGELMDKAEILGDLKFRKIQFGIDEKVINDFLENRQYCKEFVIAQGKPVREGKDAYIEYLFKTDLSQRPAQNEDGSVDYNNLDNLCHCKKGDILARMIPADPGDCGMNVRGETVKPKIPRNVNFQFGHNISKSENGLELISEVNGHVTLVEGKVFVSSVLTVANVDPATGNIDYDGSVEVEGNVVSGFTVKATGNVEVKGVVEGAHVIAGGQIIIKRGINGMAKGILEAGSNIVCKFIENAKVHAAGYVETDSILHSTVTAGSHVVVQGKRGFITGGVVRAGQYVEAKTLGSDMGVDTILEVGTDPALKIRYTELQKETIDLRKEITRLEPVVKAIGEKLGKGEKLSIDQMKNAKIISTNLAKMKEQMKADLTEMAKLEIQFDECSDAFIRVTGQAYAGTKLSVSEVSMVLKTAYHYCRFVREGADVVMRAF